MNIFDSILTNHYRRRLLNNFRDFRCEIISGNFSQAYPIVLRHQRLVSRFISGKALVRSTRCLDHLKEVEYRSLLCAVELHSVRKAGQVEIIINMGELEKEMKRLDDCLKN